MPSANLPPVSPWSTRRKSLPRLAGGNEQQLNTLRWLFDETLSQNHTIDSLWRAYMDRYRLRPSSAEINVKDLRGCRFIDELPIQDSPSADLPVMTPSSTARRWLESGNEALAIGLLHANVRFVGELLHELRAMPLTRDDLLGRANTRYGLGWRSKSQIGDRLCWLRSAGYVVAADPQLRAITSSGVEFVSRLDLHSA